jgi:spore coat protein U-like protein
MMGGTGTDVIPYSFTYMSTGSGNGRTAPITMNIAGTVVAADYLDAAAGSYSDTVTLTIDN